MKKVAFVTGGCQGIGRAISLRLARDGFSVAICDLEIQNKRALDLIKEIEGFNASAIFIPTDVTNKQEVENAVDQTHQSLGSFDVMVNNAGICKVNQLLTLSEDELDTHWAVNVKGLLFGMQAAVRKFKETGKKKGKIVNGASVGAQLGLPTMGAYCSTKFAVKGLTQTAAQEFASLGINVNSYCPGPVNTSLFEEIINKTVELGIGTKEECSQTHLRNVAQKRAANPEDIVGLVSFLASEDSDFITGQSILVDGGLVYR